VLIGVLVWELWNVLVQLAFTILIAYAIMSMLHKVQIAISVGLLILAEILYRFYNPEDPFNKGESFGSWFDHLVMGEINYGGWETINFIPTAAHTIWGVISGQLILSRGDHTKRVKTFVVVDVVLLVIGLLIVQVGITPVVKRITTLLFT
jgi:predicted acyltransferase